MILSLLLSISRSGGIIHRAGYGVTYARTYMGGMKDDDGSIVSRNQSVVKAAVVFSFTGVNGSLI